MCKPLCKLYPWYVTAVRRSAQRQQAAFQFSSSPTKLARIGRKFMGSSIEAAISDSAVQTAAAAVVRLLRCLVPGQRGLSLILYKPC